MKRETIEQIREDAKARALAEMYRARDAARMEFREAVRRCAVKHEKASYPPIWIVRIFQQEEEVDSGTVMEIPDEFDELVSFIYQLELELFGP